MRAVNKVQLAPEGIIGLCRQIFVCHDVSQHDLLALRDGMTVIVRHLCGQLDPFVAEIAQFDYGAISVHGHFGRNQPVPLVCRAAQLLYRVDVIWQRAQPIIDLGLLSCTAREPDTGLTVELGLIQRAVG